MSAFGVWTRAVQSAGAVATAWPFADGLYGQWYGAPAARWPVTRYAAVFGGPLIPADAAQQTDHSNGYVYVLAPAEVIADAPHTMTGWERWQNKLFMAGDTFADRVGMPSLQSMEDLIKKVALALGVALTVAYVMNRRR